MLFKVHYSFQTADTPAFREEQNSIQYEAASQPQAIKDFVRWWKNRHEAAPEHFKIMLAFKLHYFIPKRIEADGYLPSDVAAFGYYEWKSDWPGAAKTWKELESLDTLPVS